MTVEIRRLVTQPGQEGNADEHFNCTELRGPTCQDKQTVIAHEKMLHTKQENLVTYACAPEKHTVAGTDYPRNLQHVHL